MATVIRYVNTASTAGGDGTTNATTGANRAYASLAEWNTAEATDLVTAGDLHEVRCSAEGGPDTSTLTSWTGWTTGASNFILIKGNPADTTYGRNISRNFNTTNFRILWSEPASTYKIYNPPRFTQWWDVQFHVTGPGFGVSFDEFIQINNSDSHYFYRCRFKNENIGWAATDAFISSENTSNNTQLHHCTFENTASASPTGRAVKASNGSIRAYNCVFTGWDIGLRYESVYTNVAQSCVFFDNDDDILVFSGSPTISYCASDDGDGTNSQDLSDDVDTDCADEAAQHNVEMTDPYNGDFSPCGTTSVLYANGIAPPTLTVDLENNTITNNSIGAYDAVTGTCTPCGGGAAATIEHKRVRMII